MSWLFTFIMYAFMCVYVVYVCAFVGIPEAHTHTLAHLLALCIHNDFILCLRI